MEDTIIRFCAGCALGVPCTKTSAQFAQSYSTNRVLNMASSKSKTSRWTRKYFVVQEREVIDKKTKKAKSELFDVCNLPKIAK